MAYMKYEVRRNPSRDGLNRHPDSMGLQLSRLHTLLSLVPPPS